MDATKNRSATLDGAQGGLLIFYIEGAKDQNMSDYSEDDPNPSRKYIFGKPLKPGQITFGEYSKTPEGQAFLEEIADLIKNVVDGINDDPVNKSNLAKLKLMLDSSDPHDRVFAKYILDSPIENIYEFRQAFLDEIQNVKLPPEMRPDDQTGKNDPKIRPNADIQKRQDAIQELIKEANYFDYQLVQLLKERYNIDTSDATVKRDRDKLGIKKRDQ